MQLNQVLDWLQSPRAEQAARVVALLLGFWLLFRLAVLVWQVVPAPQLAEVPAPVPGSSAVAAAPSGQPRLNIAQVVGWHLFGAPAATPVAASGTPIDAPDTRLNLVLRGVLSSQDAEEARAIIAEPNGNENFFRVGSALPGGAELKEIYADRIILMRAGRHETLRLPREAMEGASVTTPAARPADQGAAIGGNAGAVLSEYRDKMVDNPQALMDVARPIPYTDPKGQFGGFRLFPGNKPGLFAQLGLQPGDVVKEVNGVVLDSPMKGNEIMQQLRDNKQLALRIERGGQEINLAVDIP